MCFETLVHPRECTRKMCNTFRGLKRGTDANAVSLFGGVFFFVFGAIAFLGVMEYENSVFRGKH